MCPLMNKRGRRQRVKRRVKSNTLLYVSLNTESCVDFNLLVKRVYQEHLSVEQWMERLRPFDQISCVDVELAEQPSYTKYADWSIEGFWATLQKIGSQGLHVATSVRREWKNRNKANLNGKQLNCLIPEPIENRPLRGHEVGNTEVQNQWKYTLPAGFSSFRHLYFHSIFMALRQQIRHPWKDQEIQTTRQKKPLPAE